MIDFIKNIIGIILCRLNHITYIDTPNISLPCKIVNKCKMGGVKMGRNVTIRAYTHIYASANSELTFSDDVEIGKDSTIACRNKLFIGKGVLTGPHVFIADHNHQYKDPTKYVSRQGVYPNDGCVCIGDGCWLGTNVVIVGKVSIGKQCVIGANSVVTKDIPAYSVAAGIPARVIKRYDFKTKQWIKIKQYECN